MSDRATDLAETLLSPEPLSVSEEASPPTDVEDVARRTWLVYLHDVPKILGFRVPYLSYNREFPVWRYWTHSNAPIKMNGKRIYPGTAPESTLLSCKNTVHGGQKRDDS